MRATGGQVAWEAHYTPFGRAAVISQGPTFNLRFPGQYFDAETGRQLAAPRCGDTFSVINDCRFF